MPADAAELGFWNDRRFRLLYSANLLSSLGSTFSPIGTAFGTLDLTHSTSDLGYVLCAPGLAAPIAALALRAPLWSVRCRACNFRWIDDPGDQSHDRRR
jgi:hypothetical protein